MRTKALRGLKITDADQGRVQAVFATFNVKDHDGDVTLPGAFGEQQVRVSAYNHKSWAGALPVGKGSVYEQGDEAIADLQFFMNTSQGRDTFETVKAMGDLQEWSYGYDVDEAEPGTKDGESVQFLKRVKVHEVSPVLLGAGVETRTLATKGHAPKCAECEQPTMPLFDGAGNLKAAICERGHIDRTAKQLDSDLEEEITDAGIERFGSADTYVWLYDHDVDENWAVFTLSQQNGMGDTQFVRVEFTRNDDGSVTLQPGQVNVEPQTTFVPEKAKTPDDAGETKDAETPAGTEPEPGGRKLADHLNDVGREVDEIAERVEGVVTLRSEQGKSLGETTRESVLELADRLDAKATTLREVVTSAEEPEPDQDRPGLDGETAAAEAEARLRLAL